MQEEFLLLRLKFRTIQKKGSLPHENTTLIIQSDLSRQAKNVSPSNTSTMAVTSTWTTQYLLRWYLKHLDVSKTGRIQPNSFRSLSGPSLPNKAKILNCFKRGKRSLFLLLYISSLCTANFYLQGLEVFPEWGVLSWGVSAAVLYTNNHMYTSKKPFPSNQ